MGIELEQHPLKTTLLTVALTYSGMAQALGEQARALTELAQMITPQDNDQSIAGLLTELAKRDPRLAAIASGFVSVTRAG